MKCIGALLSLPPTSDGHNAYLQLKRAIELSDDAESITYVVRRLPLLGTPILKAARNRLNEFEAQLKTYNEVETVMQSLGQNAMIEVKPSEFAAHVADIVPHLKLISSAEGLAALSIAKKTAPETYAAWMNKLSHGLGRVVKAGLEACADVALKTSRKEEVDASAAPYQDTS